MNKLTGWLRQPSTIAGLSGLVAIVCALLTGQIDWAQAAPLIAGAAVSIAMPDNTGARQAAQTLARDFTRKE